MFKKPSVTIVEKLLENVEGDSQMSFDKKIEALLNGLAE